MPAWAKRRARRSTGTTGHRVIVAMPVQPKASRCARSAHGGCESVVAAFVPFDAAPCTRGVQRIAQAIDVADADHPTSVATVDFLDVDGVRAPPGGYTVSAAGRPE